MRRALRVAALLVALTAPVAARTPAPQFAELLALQPDVAAQSLQFGQECGGRVTAAAFVKHRDALRALGLNL